MSEDWSLPVSFAARKPAPAAAAPARGASTAPRAPRPALAKSLELQHTQEQHLQQQQHEEQQQQQQQQQQQRRAEEVRAVEPVLARSPPAVRLFAAEPAPPPLPLTPPPASPPAAAAVRKSHADAASASVQKARSMASSERFALGSSSSALLESVMEESDLDELMSIPKLPFEIVDEGGPPDTLTASAPASSGSLRAPPVPDQTLRPPLPVTPPPQERRKSKRSDHKVAKQVSDGPRVPTMSIQRIDKALINTDLDGRGVVKWCSWCFQYAPQRKLENRWVGRNAHECGHCFNETCVCLMCSEGACRSYGGTADKLCFKCDGTFAKTQVASAMKAEGVCSLCNVRTSHTLQKGASGLGSIGILGERETYACDACGKATMLCKRCTAGFCAEGDTMCNKCKMDDIVAAGGAVSPAVSSPSSSSSSSASSSNNSSDDEWIDGWCSWCIEDSRHDLFTRSVLMRNVYKCAQCGHRTLTCVQCDVGMSRGGVGWDDKLCVSCFLKNADQLQLRAKPYEPDEAEFEGTGITRQRKEQPWDWSCLKAKKDAVFDPSRYTHSRVMTLLCQASPFKDTALEQGMVKPFFCLLSMRPSKRNRVANECGWSCVPSALFGDAHAEAWEIINANHLGLQARLHTTVEKLNPVGRNICWLEVLQRVTLLFGKLESTEDTVAHLQPQDLVNESRKPYSHYVKLQENVLMGRLGRLYYKYLMANHLKPPQGDKATSLLNKIKDATGMTDSYGLAWATAIFFKPRDGVPKFAETFDSFMSSREDAQSARALVVVIEILKQMLRLQTGFAVFVDDYFGS